MALTNGFFREAPRGPWTDPGFFKQAPTTGWQNDRFFKYAPNSQASVNNGFNGSGPQQPIQSTNRGFDLARQNMPINQPQMKYTPQINNNRAGVMNQAQQMHDERARLMNQAQQINPMNFQGTNQQRFDLQSGMNQQMQQNRLQMMLESLFKNRM